MILYTRLEHAPEGVRACSTTVLSGSCQRECEPWSPHTEAASEQLDRQRSGCGSEGGGAVALSSFRIPEG